MVLNPFATQKDTSAKVEHKNKDGGHTEFVYSEVCTVLTQITFLFLLHIVHKVS